MRTCKILHTFPKSWEVWRHNGINAEDAATLAGENPWETPEELLRRKASATPERKPLTPAMVAGKAARPDALEHYRLAKQIPNLRPTSFENRATPWMIAHVDLFDIRSLHIAEVHCGEAALAKAQNGHIPKPYWAEAQHTLMTTGLKFLHVYFHNAANPRLTPKTFIVRADPDFQKDLLTKETAFYQSMMEGRSTAAKLLQVLSAIKGTGPRVNKTLWKEVVPTFITSTGTITPKGAQLIAS